MPLFYPPQNIKKRHGFMRDKKGNWRENFYWHADGMITANVVVAVAWCIE